MNDFETTGPLHALARRLAVLLNGWRYAEPEGQYLPVTATLLGQGERELSLRASEIYAKSDWRVIVSGAYPTDIGQGYFRPEGGTPHISCAANRADEAIAHDILRRFLLDYERCYERALELRESWRGHVGAVADRTNGIAQALGEHATAKTRDLRGEVYASAGIGKLGITVTVSEHDSTWTIRYATPELEARLAEALREAFQ